MASTQSISVNPFPPARRLGPPRYRLGRASRSTSSSRLEATHGGSSESRAGYHADATQGSDKKPTFPKVALDVRRVGDRQSARSGSAQPAHTVEHRTVWTDTVGRGPMLRQGGNQVFP